MPYEELFLIVFFVGIFLIASIVSFVISYFDFIRRNKK